MAHAHSHGSSAPPSPEVARAQRRALGWMLGFLIPIGLATIAALVLMWPHNMQAHVRADSATVMVEGVTLPGATVTMVNEISCDGMTGSVADETRPCAQLQVHLDEGPEAGQTKEVPLTAAHYSSGVEVGDQIKVYRTPSPQDGSVNYQFAEFQRSAPLIFFAAVFALLVVVVARWRGFASLLGLVFAGAVMWKFMFPALIVGHNPTLVGLTASSAIMFVVLYAAHGFSTRTTTALVGTLAGLLIAAGLGYWATKWAHLTGVSNEDDFLLASAAPDLNLQAMVMCGVVIAGLGVLNDVTITQASAVWEIADGQRGRGELFKGAMRIGRDHIASTVYTTAFATAGAILPTLLLLTMYQRPFGEVMTGEMFAGELVRTLVGSIGLVLSVPMTTAIAAAAVAAGGGAKGGSSAAPLRAKGSGLREESGPRQADLASQPSASNRRGRGAAAADHERYRRPGSTGPDEV